MDKQEIIKLVTDYVENSPENVITEDFAINEEVVGMKIFDTPLLAFGDADNEDFKLLKDPSVIGEHFMLPKEWLPEAKTVISIFLPFTEDVRKNNREYMDWPSPAWLHGRIEGQEFIKKLAKYLKTELINSGYKAIVPAQDERFWGKNDQYTSNWSERHVAYVCGLGTFGLSKGLITKKGIAGRFCSVITDLSVPYDTREYKDIYEYCIMCGKCAENCPANAISLENGKDHRKCHQFLLKTAEKFKPRVGCGKCQVAVPCENKIPKR